MYEERLLDGRYRCSACRIKDGMHDIYKGRTYKSGPVTDGYNTIELATDLGQ